MAGPRNALRVDRWIEAATLSERRGNAGRAGHSRRPCSRRDPGLVSSILVQRYDIGATPLREGLSRLIVARG